MSDAVTALKGARFQGIADLTELPLQGMITLRGDLSAAGMKKAVKSATGLAIPDRRGIETGDDHAVAWMSPDELLLLCPHARAAETVASLSKALAKDHALAVDVSDARAFFELSGLHARDVLAKLCPMDMAPSAFGPGQIRRTRMAQVPAAIWLSDEDSFRIICVRSVAQYVFDLLCVAAQDGSEVGLHA